LKAATVVSVGTLAGLVNLTPATAAVADAIHRSSLGHSQGLPGPHGAQSSRGNERDPIWCDDDDEAVCQGPQGPQGTHGFQGTIGAQGSTGAKGAQGTRGIAGALGPRGFQGGIGAQGSTGAPGTQGFPQIVSANGTAGTAQLSWCPVGSFAIGGGVMAQTADNTGTVITSAPFGGSPATGWIGNDSVNYTVFAICQP
jgi:hypothetical protein